MHVRAIVGGKLIRLKLSPGLATAWRQNKGRRMSEAEAIQFVERKRRACALPSPILRLVLDTCVLKLATLPNPENKVAFIWELCRQGCFEIYCSPDTLVEYHRVLADYPRFLEEIQEQVELCYPLFTATAITHEPDNRFLEVALAVQADYLLTVNTARGHFDQKMYEIVRVVTPGDFWDGRMCNHSFARCGLNHG